MSRSKWKIPVVRNNTTINDNKVLQRHFQIPSSAVEQYVQIYTGKEYKTIKITRQKIGFKYGFFCFTRKFTKKIVVSKNKKQPAKKITKKK